MTRHTADILILIWFAALLLFMAALAGCAPVRPASVQATGNAIARIDARAQGIQADADRLKPLTNDAGLPLLGAVKDSAGMIRSDAGEAQASNAATAAQLQAAHDDYTRLEARWYVWAGRKIEWVIGLALAAWAVIGVLGVAMLAFFPGAWIGGIGKQLLNFLPLAHPFTILANWIGKKQAATNSTPITINVNGGVS